MTQSADRREHVTLRSMPEASAAQGILKRLIEAEVQAREILKAADESAQSAIAQAREEAAQSLDAARRETSSVLHDRLADADLQGAAQMKQRIDQAEAEARDFDRRSNEHVGDARDMVVDWVTTGATDLSLFSYAAAQGYIRARLSRLLDRATWDRLLEAAHSSELASFLARPRWPRRSSSDGRIRLQILRGEVADAGSALVRFLPRDVRRASGLV